MGLGGVAIAVLPSMIYPKQPFSDGLGEGERNLLVTWERLSTMDRQTKCLIQTNLTTSQGWCL